MEQDKNHQREVTIAYIDRERAIWLAAKAVAERSEGWNGEAVQNQKVSMEHIDKMLDEYNGTPA